MPTSKLRASTWIYPQATRSDGPMITNHLKWADEVETL